MIRGSILNPSKKGGVKRRDLRFVLSLLSLIFAISLIYTVKMRKKLLFFTDSLPILRERWKKPREALQEALYQKIEQDKHFLE
jgi:hypothetical protein